MQSLAVKYRPKTWDDLIEQGAIKQILQNQLDTDSIKNAYLFVGPAGCGKTTVARIFANLINNNCGSPIEIDAASNSGVDNVRDIIQQAKTRSLDSEYKVFIIDECHSLSNTAWQALLKLIEEPPATSVFIFATTDPQKIPKTILSRVQRFNFSRISQKGIESRLHAICVSEEIAPIPPVAYDEVLSYIAKLADGGMRDAITLLDKYLSYSKEFTMDSLITALGIADYKAMIDLTDYLRAEKYKEAISLVETLYNSGADIKQFVSQYCNFLLDVYKLYIGCDWYIIKLPHVAEIEAFMDNLRKSSSFNFCVQLLHKMVQLNSDIKYSQTPKYDFEAQLVIGFNNEG